MKEVAVPRPLVNHFTRQEPQVPVRGFTARWGCVFPHGLLGGILGCSASSRRALRG